MAADGGKMGGRSEPVKIGDDEEINIRDPHPPMGGPTVPPEIGRAHV